MGVMRSIVLVSRERREKCVCGESLFPQTSSIYERSLIFLNSLLLFYIHTLSITAYITHITYITQKEKY
jgi:hypothetical protein